MSDTARSRRSDATRAAILTAARERFAADGYERATIRAIAAGAGIDPALVMRYYGNKEKLFATAAEFDLHLPDLTGLPPEQVGERLVRHLLTRWETDDTLPALLRAATTNEPAAARMRVVFGQQLVPTVARICPDSAEAARRAALLASQMLGLALCRYVLRLPPMVTMSADEMVNWLGPTVTRYLTAPE